MAHTFHPLPTPGADNGAALSSLFAAAGPNTTIYLLPSTLYTLQTPVKFHHPYNQLATLGSPSVISGTLAILETRGDDANAVDMVNIAGCTLRNVHIRGCRGWGRTKPSEEEAARMKMEGKLGWIEGGAALVLVGGVHGSDAVVRECRLEDPRGWTALHVCDWAEGAQIIDNIVGPCGQEASAGPWADGLSIAGKNTLVQGNMIADATDGAIVIFCAPGSKIINNTIKNETRDLMGAINMVDDLVYGGDFRGTEVVDNIIQTSGDAHIRLGIGCGPTCWAPFNPSHTLNDGGSVLGNRIGPGSFGYGIALSSVKDFTVLHNVLIDSPVFTGDTRAIQRNAPPTSFLRQYQASGRTINCVVQDELVEGEASWLIGIERGLSEKLRFEGGQLSMKSGEAVRLQGGAWTMRHGSFCCIRDDGQVLVSLGGGTTERGTSLVFSKEGRLTITSSDGSTLWNATASLQPSSTASHPSLELRTKEPFLTLFSSDGNIIFATSYVGHPDSWGLFSSHYISIPPIPPPIVTRKEGGPPPIPPRPHETLTTHLYLSPSAQLSLHTSSLPQSPEPRRTIWSTPPVTSSIESWLAFQQDGNLVIYYREVSAGEVKVAWASGSCVSEGRVRVERDEVRVEMDTGVLWSSKT